MNIYIILLYILMILSIIELFALKKKVILYLSLKEKKTLNIQNLVAFAIACTLIIISGFRDITVGRDLTNYVSRYEELGNSSWTELFTLSNLYSFEYGFSVFCKVLYIINSSPYFFLLITSILVVCGFHRLSKYSKLPIVTYFLIYSFGLFGSSMNVIRQFVAISILIFGIKYLLERRLWKYIIFIIVATLFHSASIIFISLYFLYDIKFNNKSFVAFIFGCMFMMFLGNRLIYLIISRTSFAWYLLGIGEGSGESMLVMLMAILTVAYLCRKKIYRIDKVGNLWIWGIGMAVLFNTFALSLAVFERAMKFFLPFMAVLVPDILLAIKKNTIIYIIGLVTVITFFVFFFNVIIIEKTATGEGWFPYILRQ